MRASLHTIPVFHEPGQDAWARNVGLRDMKRLVQLAAKPGEEMEQ
jgi:hypothetical protein